MKRHKPAEDKQLRLRKKNFGGHRQLRLRKCATAEVSCEPRLGHRRSYLLALVAHSCPHHGKGVVSGWLVGCRSLLLTYHPCLDDRIYLCKASFHNMSATSLMGGTPD